MKYEGGGFAQEEVSSLKTTEGGETLEKLVAGGDLCVRAQKKKKENVRLARVNRGEKKKGQEKKKIGRSSHHIRPRRKSEDAAHIRPKREKKKEGCFFCGG